MAARGVRLSNGSKSRKLHRAFLAVLFLAGAWLLSWLGAQFLIVRAPLEHADAIVVLSGSSTIRERAEHAAALYSQNRSQRILLTSDNQQGSWSEPLQRNPYSYERATEELIRQGVPADHIELIEPPIYSTWDEAKLVNEFAQKRRLQSILVVTSSYHSRRALWTFRRVFSGSTIRVGMDPVGTGIQTPFPTTWWLHIRGWQIIPTEYFKFGFYLVRGVTNSG